MARSKRLIVVSIVLFVLLIGGTGGLYALYRHQQRAKPELHRQQAIALEQKEEWAVASRHWWAYLSSYPKDVDKLVHYAEVLLKQTPITAEIAQKAAGALRRAARVDPSHRDAHAQLMNLLLRGGAYDDALHVADELWLQKGHEDDADALLCKARAEWRLGHNAASLDTYRKLVEVHPDSVEGMRELVLYSQRSGADAATIDTILQTGIDSNPDKVEPLLLMVMHSMRRGTDEAALTKAGDYLDDAEAVAPNAIEVRLTRAAWHGRKGEAAEAENLLAAVVTDYADDHRAYLQLGRLLSMQERADEALALFAKALENVSEQREILFLAADVAASERQNDLARDYIARLKKISPNSAWLDYLDGRLLMNAGSASQAAFRLEAAVRALPDEPICHFLLGQCYAQLGVPVRAWAELSRATQLAPSFLAARKAEARALLAMGRPTAAAARLRALMDAGVEDYDLIMLTARALIGELSRRPRAAEQPVAEVTALLVRARALRPDAVEPVEFRAEMLRIVGQYDEAVAELTASLQARPDNVGLYRTLGLLHQRQGNRAQVEPVIASIQERCEDTIEARVARATLHAVIEDIDAAKSTLLEGIEQRPDEEATIAYFRLGLILAEVDRPREALGYLLQATQRGSDNIPLHRFALHLARVVGTEEMVTGLLAALRKVEGEDGVLWRFEQARHLLVGTASAAPNAQGALALLDELLADGRPNWPEAIALRGVCQELLDDTEGAADSYRQAVSIDPDNLRNQLLLVDSLYKLKQFDAGDEALATVANSVPNNAALLRRRVQQSVRVGAPDDTRALLEQYLTVAPGDAAGHILLGQMHTRSGQYEKADKEFQEALKFAPNSLLARSQQLLLFILRGENDRALEEARAYVKAEPGVIAHLLVAQVHALLKDVASCEKECENAIGAATAEEKPGLLTACARLLTDLGSSRAVPYFQQALQLDPKRTLAIEGLIRAHLSRSGGQGAEEAQKLAQRWLEQSPDEAQAHLYIVLAKRASRGGGWTKPLIDELRRFATTYPRSFRIRQVLASAFLTTGRPKLAVEELLYVLALRSNDLLAKTQLVRAYRAGKEFRSAVYHAKQLARERPRDKKLAILLGRCLLENGDHEGAVTALRRLIDDDADPASAANARFALAKVYAVQDRYAEMESTIAPLLEHRDVRFLAARSVAQWLQERERLELAEQYIRSLIEEDEPDPRVLHVLVNVMATQPNAGERRDAIRDLYRRAASDAAIAPQVYSDWGTFESEQKQPAEAETALRKALALQPEQPVTLNNLAWFLSEQPSGLSEALELIDQAIGVAPWGAELHHTRGQILFKQKSHEAAVIAYRRAEAIGKQDADLYGDLARAYAALGDATLRDDAVRRFGDQFDLDVKEEKTQELARELEALAPQK